MTQIHTSYISDLYHKARNLCSEIKKMTEADQDQQILEKFEAGWRKLEAEISKESQIDQMSKTNAAHLSSNFMSVNNFMVDIKPIQLKEILLASKTK